MFILLLMSVLLLCYLVVASNPWVSHDTIDSWMKFLVMTLLCFLHWMVISSPLFIAVSVCASLVMSYPDTVLSTASALLGAVLIVPMFLIDSMALMSLILYAFNINSMALASLVLYAFNVKVSGVNSVHEWLEGSKIPLVHAMILLVVCVTSLVAEGYFLVNMLSRTL